MYEAVLAAIYLDAGEAEALAYVERSLGEALRHPLIMNICRTLSYTVPATNMSEARKLTNTNSLLFKDSKYFCEYCTGGKTGYTDNAGYCLATTSESEDKSLICVVLGANAAEIPIETDEEDEDEYDSDEEPETEYVIRSFSESTARGSTQNLRNCFLAPVS